MTMLFEFGHLRSWITPIVMWLFFSAASIVLVSNQYTAVDRALRCLTVYWHRPPYVGPNNHLLYPAIVWLWSHMIGWFGISTATPVAFLHVIAALNAICAGGSVAVVYVLVRQLTEHWQISLLAAVAYALSWALLVHATSSAEPLPGLLLSLMAVFFTITGLRRDRLALLFGCGVCLALALASYESMFLLAPILYSLPFVWLGRSEKHDGETGLSRPILQTLAALSGTASGIIVIYSVAYYSIGIRSPRRMLATFFQLGGEPEVYAGFHLAKLANLPAGLADNLVALVPRDYLGIRWLLRTDKMATAAIAGLLFTLVAIFFSLLRSSAAELRRSRRAIVVAGICFAALLCDLVPLLYWDPMYSKLWLQPFAIFAIGCGVLAARIDRAASGGAALLVLLIIAFESAVNLPLVIRAHLEPTRCLEDAEIANSLIMPSDKVITDFDPVSSLWMGLYDRDPGRTLLFPANSPSVSLRTLDRWTAECRRSGCRIVFVALLDQSRDVWDAFLGERLKVSYETLDRYRLSSNRLREFSCEKGSLRVYARTRYSG